MQNTLYVYSASAGAGKTTTIARKYLELALSYPGNYRHIQAVTFTNLATEEMKERILKDLYRLAQGKPQDEAESAYWSGELCRAIHQRTGQSVTVEELQRRAAVCLRAMLLNYGNFRISTIDSFFQEVLRLFARDLNLSGGFRIELDGKEALEAACQAVLVDEQYRGGDSPVLRWIKELSLDDASGSRSSRLMSNFQTLAGELFQDKVRDAYGRRRSGGTRGFPTVEEVQEMYHDLGEKLDRFDQQTKAIAQEVLGLVGPALEAGLPLSYGKTGGLKVFYQILGGEKSSGISDPTELRPSRYGKALENPETLFAQGNRAAARGYVDFDAITRALEAYDALIEDFLSWGPTYKVIYRHLPSFGLLSAIDAKLKADQQNNNYLLLADTPSLIYELLQDESGVPFLYERIGTEIKHHMIDEFQDTSSAQFSNFRPLLDNSLAEGQDYPQDCYIVGDVKQSIYRWRGSDSTQLGDLNSLGGRAEGSVSASEGSGPQAWNVQSVPMEDNWRSAREIVEFNNALYPMLVEQLSCQYEDFVSELRLSPERSALLEKWLGIFRANYADVAQKSQRKHKGYVCVHHFDKRSDKVLLSDVATKAEDAEGVVPERSSLLSVQLPEQIRLLKKRGYALGDIGIIVRKREEAAFVAKLLMEAEKASGVTGEFAFVSLDSLAPTDALSVNFTMAVLTCMLRPGDKECLVKLQHFSQELMNRKISEEELDELTKAGRKSLYETLEDIIVRYKEHYKPGEYPHVIKLLDTALGYQQDLSLDISDFIDMWEAKGSSLNLPMGDASDKINILTIHKAKGLAYQVVLLPFLDWELRPNNNLHQKTFIWCNNPLEGYEHSPLLPIQAQDTLLHTAFAPDYIIECIQTSIDALNLLYVATTRARSEMHLWIADPQYSKPSKKDKNERLPKSMGELLRCYLAKPSSEYPSLGGEKLRNLYHDYVGPEQYEGLGSGKQAREQTREQTPDNKVVYLEGLNSYHIGKRVEELKDGILYFTEERRLHFGNLMHDVLSHLVHRDEREAALQLAISRGELNPEELELARRRLDLLLSCPEAQPWFDGSGTVITERPILGAGPRLRPDRVMSYGRRELAVVVDYKFGRPRPEHQQQVERYAQLLKDMGYQRVEAYLWYLTGADAEEQQPMLELGCPSPILVCRL